jgi:hypothetical protein
MSEIDDAAISEAARALSKRGAAKGGRARASVLSADERSEIARKAVTARWARAKVDAGTLPFSLLPGVLQLGEVQMECHVLNDHRRVLTQREVVRTISGGRESGNLQRYLSRSPLFSGRFQAAEPIEFIIPPNRPATGYEAELLIEICDAYLAARSEKLLKPSQANLARTAEIIVRACAKVGIIALIDEATGFQELRKRNALQLKLQAFIAEEMQDWAKMFPDEFWYELARLEGVKYSPTNRPLRWGKYVMYFVYDAIDEDVGKALREQNPNPHFLQNHHQWLKKFGREKVHDQIVQVVTIMRLCNSMPEFRHKFARVFARGPLQLDFSDIDTF